jgi:hypothetical protein
MKLLRQRSFSWRPAMLILVLLLLVSSQATAASWNGIEPFKSRRADVEKILGQSISQNPNGPLLFKVLGGTVSVSFVDANFVRTKKMRPELEGTVLQIILQHENSSDTPESLHLLKNRDFDREDTKNAAIYRNLKDGIVYTFILGNLKTTRYTFSENQISRVRR